MMDFGLSRFVAVRFFLPGAGSTGEVFDRQQPGDRAAWDENQKMYRSQVVGYAAEREAFKEPARMSMTRDVFVSDFGTTPVPASVTDIANRARKTRGDRWDMRFSASRLMIEWEAEAAKAVERAYLAGKRVESVKLPEIA